MDARCDHADKLEAAAAQAVAALRLAVVPGRDWLDELLGVGGDGLTSTEAAIIAGTSDSTVRRRAVDAALTDKPIGILMAGAVWLFSLCRLLDAIEEEKGRPARLAAQSRADKNAGLRGQRQKSADLQLQRQTDGGDRGRAA
jgi:hypothetical protein